MAKYSNLEKKVYQYLKDFRYKFKVQYRVGNFKVDFFLTDYDMTVQVDGSYYHGVCIKCKNARVQKHWAAQKYRDGGCIVYHKSVNLSILRICECEINDDQFQKIIVAAIKDILLGKKVYRNREFN